MVREAANRKRFLMAEHTIPVPSGETKKPETERRAWVRIPTSKDVSCQPVAAATAVQAETSWLGNLRNISLRGLSLVLDRRFEAGSLLIIELADNAKAGGRFWSVRVVNVTPEVKKRWIMGCEFIRPLSQEELQTLRGTESVTAQIEKLGVSQEGPTNPPPLSSRSR
jgi:hypothetical protein